MKILLVNNQFWSWWMRIYWEQLIKSLNYYNKNIEVTYYNNFFNNIEDFDYIFHFWWNQFLGWDFENCDFKTSVSKNRGKNILFIFFDLDFLNKKLILDIKNNFNYIVYDSNFSFEKWKKYLGNLKSKIIQPWLSEESLFYYLHSEKYLFLKDWKFNFLHINNTWYIKWIDVLLEVFINFLENNNNVRLILKINKKVSDYIYYNFKEDLDFLIKKEKIFIIDFEIEQKDIFGLYKVSNSYVNTSINETFSLPTLESLFFWLDVISSFELWMKEFISKRKWVYKLEWSFDKISKKVWKNNFLSVWFFIDKNTLSYNLGLSLNKNIRNKKIRFDIFERYNFLQIWKKILEII